MRTIIFHIIIISVCCISASAQKTDQNSTAAKEVFATIVKWAEAVRVRDTKTLDSIFEADVIITSFDGTTRGKTEELEIFKPGGSMKTTSIINDDLRVRVIDKTAIATALMRMKFTVGEQESSAAFRWTAVFVKSDGRWQIVALQNMRVSSPHVSKGS